MFQIIWIITTILTFSILSLIFNKLNSKNEGINNINENNLLKANKIFLYVGIAGITILPTITIIAWFLPTSSSELEKYLYAGLVLLFSFLSGGYLIFFYINYRIIVFDNYFIYQNFWRIKKQIYFKDIVIDNSKLNPQIRLKKENGKTKLIFKLAGILENEDYFMKKYREWKKLPKAQREK